MAKPTISVENLSVAYQGKIALKNISLTIQSEKMTGIIGPNGAGKSTFMKSLLELIPKSSGTVTFSGQSVKEVRKKLLTLNNEVQWIYLFQLMFLVWYYLERILR